MKQTTRNILLLTIIVIGMSSTAAMAQVDYNAPIVWFNVEGGVNGGFNAVTKNGETCAFRITNLGTGETTHELNVYGVTAGLWQVSPPRAWGQFQWHFGSANGPIGNKDHYILIDIDPSVGVNFVRFNALTDWSDSSYGNNDTPNSRGIKSTSLEHSSVLQATFNRMQQSQNYGYDEYIYLGINPTINATYDFVAYTVEKGANPEGPRISSVQIQEVVGTGGKSATQLVAEINSSGMTHDQYVKAVKLIVDDLVGDGVLDNKARAEFISTAAMSGIGK